VVVPEAAVEDEDEAEAEDEALAIQEVAGQSFWLGQRVHAVVRATLVDPSGHAANASPRDTYTPCTAETTGPDTGRLVSAK
jgi:hypothetical protein